MQKKNGCLPVENAFWKSKEIISITSMEALGSQESKSFLDPSHLQYFYKIVVLGKAEFTVQYS